MDSTQNGILIVGDWVVDEYWFLVRHYSDISSHTGLAHYRIASKPEEIVSDLCGAGHVARILYQLRDHSAPYRLWGVGVWNESDSELIQHLIHARDENVSCKAASASFRLQADWCDNPPEIDLATLEANGSTTRVIRLYHQERGNLEQINRIDWEPPRRAKNQWEILWNKVSLPRPEELGMIVVNDLGKGVINREIVSQLRSRYPSSEWYVRSKIREPGWVKEIGGALALLVIGPEIAAMLNPWDRWLVGDRITLQGMEIIDKLPGKNVVLLSDQREVLARLNYSKECVTSRSQVSSTILTRLGWPSAFFASLIREAHENSSDITDGHISRAQQQAEMYSGVPLPGDRAVKVPPPPPHPRVSTWQDEKKYWEQATIGCGVIESDDGALRLDVWRGSTLLPGYIACIKEKQRAISKISQHLLGFKRSAEHTHPLCIMLQADPGAGKTFLAKSLASAFNFSFLRFDITQMLHRDELLDLFDMVATRQANDQDILVFVDEINARLDAAYVYGAFLAPLEEGFYMRRGNMFSLKPCVWIFAGTNRRTVTLDSEGDKLEDFNSRMTLIEKVDYNSLRDLYSNPMELEREARLEQVYLGATMIRKFFSDVKEISKEVLLNFWDMDPSDAPARRIRKNAALLRNVQYGRVTRDNCQRWEQTIWNRTGGEKMVKLDFRN